MNKPTGAVDAVTADQIRAVMSHLGRLGTGATKRQSLAVLRRAQRASVIQRKKNKSASISNS